MSIIPDFYHGDTVTDWNILKKNVPFVVFKATEGTSFVSPKLDEYIAKCESHRIPYWVYAFLKKGNELEQTKHMVSVCKGKVGQFFQGYVLDVERQNAEADVQMAFKWLTKNAGTKTMVYTFYSDYPTYKNVIDNRGGNCAWWEARTKKVDTGKYDPEHQCHAAADLYQYTWKGSCPGIKNKCDLSRLTGTKPESWFTGKKEVTEVSKGVTAKTIIDIMEGWKGLSRKDKSHKVIIDTYNSYRPLPRGYAVTYTDNYCATTISAAYIKANAVKLIGGIECSVERMIEDCFKPIGIWEEDGRKTPKEGWIITYNWDDKTQPNDGWADHIGLVKTVKDGIITVIEGNYGGVVKERKIKVGDGRIRGYAIPKYAVTAKVAKSASQAAKTGKLGYSGTFPVVVNEGGRTNWVKGDGITTRRNYPTQIKRIQQLVGWITGEDIHIDGQYGDETEKIVRKAQKILKVTEDGKFGKQTLEAAKKYRK